MTNSRGVSATSFALPEMNSPHYNFLQSVVAMVFFAVNLCACATQQPADPTKLRSVDTIVLSGFSEPNLQVLAGGVAPFSLGDFAEKMAQQQLKLGAETKATLSSALEGIGYKVEVNNTSKGDAVLDGTFKFAGYVVYPIILGGGVNLIVTFEAKLTDTKTGASLFSRGYVYETDPDSGLRGLVEMPADPKYNFANTDAIDANPELAAEGLRSFAPALAASIAKDFAKQ